MDIFSGEKRVFLLMVLLGTLFLAGIAYTQDAPPADAPPAGEQPAGEAGEAGEAENQALDPNVWKAQRKEIFREIDKEAERRAKETVTREKIALLLNTRSNKYEEDVRNEQNRDRRKFIVSEQNKWRNMEDMPDSYPNMSKYLDIVAPQWELEKGRLKSLVKRDMLKIREDMEKELTAIFEKHCKPKNIEDLEREGQEKYPMYKIEDGKKKPYVTNITLRGGRGYAANKIEGRLEAITVNRLKIGPRMISRNDLDEDTQALFYDEVNQKMVEKYVLQEQRRYKAIKEGFVNDWVFMVYPDMLMAEGYVPKQYLLNKVQRRSTNVKNWIPRDVYFENLYNVLLKKEIERIKPEITKDFFENAVEKFGETIGCTDDFEFVKEAGEPEGTGEWMPKSVAADFRMKKEQQNAEPKPEGEEAPAP